MAKQKSGSKRKVSDSSEPFMDTDEEDCEEKSHSPEVAKNNDAFASQERRPTIFENDMHDNRLIRRSKEAEGAARPPAGRYRNEEHSRRISQGWREDYGNAYGQTHGGQYSGPSRRPWSPSAFGGPRDYDGRPLEYAPRSGHYDGRSQYQERRDPYYDARGLELNRRGREYEDHRRFDDPRHDRRAFQASEMYIPPSEDTGVNQYAGSIMRKASPPPSSSGIVLNDRRLDGEPKRPVRLDKTGFPEGKMATLLHANIVRFVKDIDPTVGWEAQTKESKERIRQRILMDYEFSGESTKLSEKYLRKCAGVALSQFRYTLNQLIDKEGVRPSDVHPTYWDALVDKRMSKEGQAKSVKMASIARGRGSKNTTKKSVE